MGKSFPLIEQNNKSQNMRENESEIEGLTMYGKLQNKKKNKMKRWLELVSIWVLMFLFDGCSLIYLFFNSFIPDQVTRT